METMTATHAVQLNAANLLYLFPNAIRDFDETDAAGTKAFAGNDIFLGAGIIQSITLSTSLLTTSPLVVQVFDAINDATGASRTQNPIAGGAVPVSAYKITTGAGVVGTKGQSAVPGPMLDPVYGFGTVNGVGAVADLANARLKAEHQVDEFGAAGIARPHRLESEIECPYGMVVRVTALSANVVFTAGGPLKVTVEYVPWTRGGMRRKWAARNAATHASKNRSLSHACLSV